MQSVDWNAAIFWLMAVQLAGTVCLGIFSWLLRRRQATKDEIAGVEERMGKRVDDVAARAANHAERLTEGDKRFQRIESHIEGLPGAETITALTLQLANLNGDLRVTNQALEGLTSMHKTLSQQVGVIDQYLRDKS